MNPGNMSDVELVEAFNSTSDESRLASLAGEMDRRGISKNAVVETIPSGDMKYVSESYNSNGSFLDQFDDTPVTEQLA